MASILVGNELVDEFELSSGRRVQYYSLMALEKKLGSAVKISRLPLSIRILLEALLRNKDGINIDDEDIRALAEWNAKNPADREIPFKVSRVLMQDLTGVPALVDLASMRDAISELKLDPNLIEPEVPVDLVIDHSVQVDAFRTADAFAINEKMEIERNKERYVFLKWAQQAFNNLKLVPPDTGIVHQVNLEFLASVVMEKSNKDDGTILAYPDSLVGTDSHTPMVNGLGVLGWGVGGIEAEAALLAQPVTFLTPEVVGIHLKGALSEGITATDAVLTIAQKLREVGVVDKFVEFFGEGVRNLGVSERATISNMTPEFGATVSLFPIDDETLHYLKMTGRSDQHVELVKKYLEAQGMFGVSKPGDIDYSLVIEIDLSKIEASVAGPSLPHDRVALCDVASHFLAASPDMKTKSSRSVATLNLDGKEQTLTDGDVVIAAITSCTNTSNPQVMIAAGLLAKRAVERGLQVRSTVKTSLAPGSMVVTEYLRATGLLPYLEALGFSVVGYGCTTCIAQGTPALLSNGTTRPIELLPKTGGLKLFGPDSNGNLQLARQTELIRQGLRDCVKLILQDGRTLVCTPDHKILCSDGRWVRADKLAIGKDRVIVGLEGPIDKPGNDETGYVLNAAEMKFSMDTEANRDRLLAFARLLGYLLGDGSISALGQGRISAGQAVDREIMLDDIELLTGRRPVGSRYDPRRWSIVLPMSLTKAFSSLPGVQVGRRIGQTLTLPSFVMEENCPVSVIREFLGGMFGADGHSPSLHLYGKNENDSTLEPPAYSQSTVAEFLNQTTQNMSHLINLLAKCGVIVEGAQVYQYPTRRGKSTYETAHDGIDRIEVRLSLPDGLSFIENIGYRYCVDKQLKATAAAVYWRIVRNIHLQRLWMAERLTKIHSEQPNLSFSKARQIVAVEMLNLNNTDIPSIIFPHYALLEGYDRFSRLPKDVARKFQPLHRKNCDFPSPVQLFKQLGVRDYFAPLHKQAKREQARRYCVEKEVTTLPTFSLQIVDRKPAGQRLVFDLSVENLHSFVAGTVAVHNCIGNSGPLPDAVANAIKENNLTVAAVLSGNRNFEARIHQDVRANFLMSPPLVVAYALAGTVLNDLTRDPLGMDKDGNPVYLKDIWPSNREVHDYATQISTQMFRSRYAQVYSQNSQWNKLNAPTGISYEWDPSSTYIQRPPYFDDYTTRHSPSATKTILDVTGARPLLILGDYVTTDHISPAGAINAKSAAAKYLVSKGVNVDDFNTYGSRRGNHNVMIRGTFANPRIKNEMVPGVEGSFTKHYPDGEVLSIFEASQKYMQEKVPLVVIGGKGFGTGSSRDWAAKGPKLLGVRAVITKSFERIHRSNLVQMGVLPLQFPEGVDAKTLNLNGSESLDIQGLNDGLKPNGQVRLIVTRANGEKVETSLTVRVDSAIEVEYYLSGSILDYVIQKIELKHAIPH